MRKIIILLCIFNFFTGCHKAEVFKNRRDETFDIPSRYFGIKYGYNMLISGQSIYWGSDFASENEFDADPGFYYGYCSDKKLLSICGERLSQPFLSFDRDDWGIENETTITSNWHKFGKYQKCARFLIQEKVKSPNELPTANTVAIFCDEIGLIMISKLKPQFKNATVLKEADYHYDTFLLNGTRGAFSNCKLVTIHAASSSSKINVKCFENKDVYRPLNKKEKP